MIFLSRPGFVFLLFVAQVFSACAQPIDDHLTLQRLPVRNKQAAKAMTEKLSSLVMKYAEANSFVASDYPYATDRGSKSRDVQFNTNFDDYDLTGTKFQNAETLYDLIFDGRPYIAGVASYVPLLKPVSSCVPSETGVSSEYCRKLAENNLVCHIFLFDFQTHEIAAVGAMPIERDNRPLPGGKKRSWINYDPKFPNDPRQIEGWPRCREVLAVAPAKVIPNALLITLSYLDSAASISKYGYEDDESKFTTTVLLRFSASSNGKVQITADQRCLGNPNTIKSIAAARKTLAKCEADSTQSNHPK